MTFSLDVYQIGTAYDVSGVAPHWFSSNLTDRWQAIKIGYSFSDMLPTSYGVPQGSILWPLLFTLYKMPLSCVIKSHNLDHHLCAADTQIYISLATPDTCRSQNQLRNSIFEDIGA